MATKETKQKIITQFKRKEDDTGSAEVQVALLTERIKELTEHLQVHINDQHSRRALLKLIGQRKRLLTYLSKTNPERYHSLIAELGLRK
jgi:small subunit ribosomal protein S15